MSNYMVVSDGKKSYLFICVMMMKFSVTVPKKNMFFIVFNICTTVIFIKTFVGKNM